MGPVFFGWRDRVHRLSGSSTSPGRATGLSSQHEEARHDQLVVARSMRRLRGFCRCLLPARVHHGTGRNELGARSARAQRPDRDRRRRPQSRTFTVRLKDTGELRMVRVDQVMARPALRAEPRRPPPRRRSRRCRTAPTARQVASAAVPAAPVAPAPPLSADVHAATGARRGRSGAGAAGVGLAGYCIPAARAAGCGGDDSGRARL